MEAWYPVAKLLLKNYWMGGCDAPNTILKAMFMMQSPYQYNGTKKSRN